ncbi:MAG: DM13 domain-containing protein [Actinomycetota bacterium]
MRSRLITLLKTRPLAAAAVGSLLAGLAVFGVIFFQPHKLFIDERVDEAVPSAGSADIGTDLAPSDLRVLSATFRSLDHETKGRAIIKESADGSLVLSFIDFETSNGPDLRVYLSAGASDVSGGEEYGKDFVELGRLKGNIGDQNYNVPADIDLAKYRNAVIWCKRFRVGFGVATFR